MGTDELNAGGLPAMDKHPIQGRVEILPVASCYSNLYKLRPDWPLRSKADLKKSHLEDLSYRSFVIFPKEVLQES